LSVSATRFARRYLPELILDQLETAIDAPAAAALQPLDDLTPLAWEVR